MARFTQNLSVHVVQMGARRDYELARMLHEREALAQLHTSAAWPEGRESSFLVRTFVGASGKALSRRMVKGIPAAKVRANFLAEPVGAVLKKGGIGDETRYRLQDWLLGLSARFGDLRPGQVLLNTAGNGGLRFLRAAKKRGLLIASDIVITPDVYDILLEEQRRWPGWEVAHLQADVADKYRRHRNALVALSDMLISPSASVDDGLANLPAFDPSKLVRVPYGLDPGRERPRAPVRRRVLFAGQAGLRKGIPYLAEAARLLVPRGYEFRVAGTTPPGIRDRAECAALTFLGHLGQDALADEFRTADVFCLPSLAEGMPRAALEALSHGIPCVVTRLAGTPVRNDVEGIVVPERDGKAIAEAVEQICEDRKTRSNMSGAAIELAKKHSLELVGDRLYSTLADLRVQNG